MDLNYRNVQNLCARVDCAVERPTIDLSEAAWFEPYAVMYIGMFLRHHNRLGKFFVVNHPTSTAAKDYLDRQNFWRRFNFTSDPDDESILRLHPETSFNDIVDLQSTEYQAEQVGDQMRLLLSRNRVAVAIDEVTIAVTELVQNFVEHADEGLAAMMTQYYPEPVPSAVDS